MAENNFIPFSLPSIGTEECEGVLDTLRSGWITTGPKVKQFEGEFAEYVGCKHAIAVNSCTAALHLALEAIGIGEGDEVITSPLTFAATAEVIQYFKAKPVFVDIDPLTMNMDVERIAAGQGRSWNSQKARAIVPVHFAGYPCEMDAINELAGRHGLKVIEDAAHAFPSYYKGRMIGKIGDITCFSFYATKNITTGEGGMITTEDDGWADRMRMMSLHGISKDAWKRYSANGNWYYEITAPGFKYNLTDIAAALGMAQLRKADDFWRRRVQIASMYNEAFRDMEEIEVTAEPGPEEAENRGREGGTIHSWHLYVIRLRLELLKIDRDRFIEELRQRGIGTSVHFIPLHIHPYYRKTYGYRAEDFPVAYETYKRTISLPIYPLMTDSDAERVAGAVADVVRLFRR
jgi:dTDP-4-amino-4,6-dideoxygalactose transaminase